MDDDDDDRHERHMREALRAAEDALNALEIPVGCVFVHGERVVATGANQTNVSRNGTRHAEMVAVESLFTGMDTDATDRRSPLLLADTDLYVTCEPCIMCAAALAKLGVRKVYFGCHNDRFGGNGSILSVHQDAYPSSSSSDVQHGATYHPYPVEAGLLKDEAIALFQRFYTMENQRAPEAKRKRRPEKTGIT